MGAHDASCCSIAKSDGSPTSGMVSLHPFPLFVRTANEQSDVACVAVAVDEPTLNGGANRAIGFVPVRTVGQTTGTEQWPNLRATTVQLAPRGAAEGERAHAGGIGEVATGGGRPPAPHRGRPPRCAPLRAPPPPRAAVSGGPRRRG